MISTQEQAIAELRDLLRARYPAIWLSTSEGRRAVACLSAAATAAERAYAALNKPAQFPVREWSCTQGYFEVGADGAANVLDAELKDPCAFLEKLPSFGHGLYILHDFDAFLRESCTVRRAFLDVVDWFRGQASFTPGAIANPDGALVVVATSSEIPAEIVKTFALVELPLPDAAVIRASLDEKVLGLAPGYPLERLCEPSVSAVVDACRGLTLQEVSNVLSRCVVSRGRFHAATIAREKAQIVRKSGVLEFVEPRETDLDVGGLDLLHAWLGQRHGTFSEEARAFGLPGPRGALILGMPGTGKSLSVRKTARAWGLPLLRLDIGRLLGPHVGESEGALRAALAVAEAVAPCICWVDEIEKALAGHGTDTSGVSTRMVGMLLTWMQDHEAPVFVMATANDPARLPPELLRAGRFDVKFFVDLPTAAEREAILALHLTRRGRDAAAFDVAKLAREAGDFMSGAELEQAIIEALHVAFADGRRDLREDDLRTALRAEQPLALQFRDKLDPLRAWARARTRLASSARMSGAAEEDAFVTRPPRLAGAVLVPLTDDEVGDSGVKRN